MTKELMAAVKERLETAEIPYQYETYQTAGKLPPVYCVGHCSGSPITEESGMMSGTFLLTLVGTSWDALVTARERICRAFPIVSGYSTSGDNYAVLLYYDSATAIPCDDARMKKIQINLKYREWSVE